MRKFQYIFILVLMLLGAGSTLAANKVVVVPLIKSPPPSTSKLIFVTNGSWTGDLGGLSGADDKCNAEAEARGFSGTFQALLGSASGRPETRSIHYPLPYISENGSYLQSGFHDLFNSGPDNPVNPDPYTRAWTGLNADGTLSGSDCNGWSDSSTGFRGSTGKVDTIGNAWLNDGGVTYSCSNTLSLYCIEQ